MSSATITWLVIIASFLTLLIFLAAPGPWRQGTMPESGERLDPEFASCPVPAAASSLFSGQGGEIPEGSVPNMDARAAAFGKELQTATFSLG